MDDHQLETLLDDLESDRVERKSSIADRDKVAEAMKNLGYVQRFGIGIALARQQLDKNGNPPPEFKAESAHVLVTLRRKI